MSKGSWRQVCLDDLVDKNVPICYGIVLPGHGYEGGVPVVKVKDIFQGTVKTEGLLKTSPEIAEKYRRSTLKAGDILLSIRGTVGRVAIVPNELAGGNITQDTARIRISCEDTRNYVFQLLQSDLIQKQIRHHVVGQAVKGINIRDVKRIKLPFPKDKYVQHVIAELFADANNSIDKTERLIEVKKKSYSWFVQGLIGEKCSSWDHLRADKVFKSISERGNGYGRLLSVTQDQGVVPRDMLEGRVMSPQGGTSLYKLIKPGDFAISLRSFQGGIEYSRYQGLISPAYTVLRPCLEIEDEFYRHFFKSYLFIEKYLSIAVIGIRDGKQINIPEFMSAKIPWPPLEQQRKIAETLNTAQQEIDLLKKQAEAYRRQKCGLIQKLLTGKWRVRDGKELVV